MKGLVAEDPHRSKPRAAALIFMEVEARLAGEEPFGMSREIR
jgi:hypothetical protein